MTTMADTRLQGWSLERFAPLTGVLAVVLWVIGVIVLETAVEMKDPATLLDSYRTEESSIVLGGFLWVLGTFFFFWFLGSLRARLAAAEGGVKTADRARVWRRRRRCGLRLRNARAGRGGRDRR